MEARGAPCGNMAPGPSGILSHGDNIDVLKKAFLYNNNNNV